MIEFVIPMMKMSNDNVFFCILCFSSNFKLKSNSIDKPNFMLKYSKFSYLFAIFHVWTLNFK